MRVQRSTGQIGAGRGDWISSAVLFTVVGESQERAVAQRSGEFGIQTARRNDRDAPQRAVAAAALAQETKNLHFKPLEIRPMLLLPALSPEVPLALSPSDTPSTRQNLGRVMLRQGMLLETDWQGDLTGSISAGLASQLKDIRADRQLYVYAQVSDDIGATYLQHCFGINELDGHGVFALVHECGGSMSICAVGAAVTALEQEMPGAGWHIVRLMKDALFSTVGGFTPHQAVEFAEERVESELEWQENDPQGSPEECAAMREAVETQDREGMDRIYEDLTGMLSPTAVRRATPAEFFSEENGDKALIQRLAGSTNPCSRAGMIAAAALRLWDKMAEQSTVFEKRFDQDYDNRDKGLAIFVNQPASLVLAWNIGDATSRAFDDWIERLNNCDDDFTDVVWYAPFRSAEPATVAQAYAEFKAVAETVAALDELADLMHTDTVMNSSTEVPIMVAGQVEVEVNC